MGPPSSPFQHQRKETGKRQIGCVAVSTLTLLMSMHDCISVTVVTHHICSYWGSWWNVDFIPISCLTSLYWRITNRSIDFCSEEETVRAPWCAGVGPHTRRDVHRLKLSEEGGKGDAMPRGVVDGTREVSPRGEGLTESYKNYCTLEKFSLCFLISV